MKPTQKNRYPIVPSSAVVTKLLTYLADRPANGRFQQWQITGINGGANNLLYRAVGDEADLAVKFTIRDKRRRAWREYQALRALQEAGLDLAPKPIFLDEETYPQPVVVQTWLAGKVTAVPPQSNDEWRRLVQHFAALATVTPETVSVPLAPAALNFASHADGLAQLQQQVNAIPPSHRPPVMSTLVARLHAASSATVDRLPPITLSLCRVDPNTLNFIRRPGAWASVDWENSGWGDPAFEIVDLMTHPRYETVAAARRQWVTALYAELTGDETAVTRIQTYYPIMLVWWVARLARLLYEAPRGGDQRLAARAPNWRSDAEAKLARYAARASRQLSIKDG